MKIKKRKDGAIFVEYQEEEDRGVDWSWLALVVFMLLVAVFYSK